MEGREEANTFMRMSARVEGEVWNLRVAHKKVLIPSLKTKLLLFFLLGGVGGFLSNTSYSMNQWSPTAWLYHAEGGKHAIFRSATEKNLNCFAQEQERIAGHVLRIPKHELASAYALCGNASADDNVAVATDYAVSNASKQETASFLFQRNVVQPLLGRSYIDLPRSVVLPPLFCARLYQQAVASGNIPPSRIQSWRIDSSETKTSTDNHAMNEGIKATLLRDHTTLIKHPRFLDQPNQNVISVEIKPKAGYITSSPLVSPKHRCKYKGTRYSLQQQLMQLGYVQKGWQHHGSETQNSKPFTPSNYSPLDLFSGNASQIQTAIKDLSNNMQNNFRAFYNGRQIFGEDITPLEGERKNILNTFVQQCGSSAFSHHDENRNADSILLDFICSIVSRILHREELLRNLLSMQLLDVIDGDGVIRVYDRLVHLCDGSNSKAEELLDQSMVCVEETVREQPKKDQLRGKDLAKSPFELPNCSVLHKLIEEVDSFQSHSTNDVDSTHELCVRLVDQLSQQGCIYLLQNWLLSLAMCDVSFFSTFQCFADDQRTNEEYQSINNGGIMHFDGVKDEKSSFRPRTMIHYEVKVVDCDAKPAKKLRSRRKVEDVFQFITS